MIEVTKLVHGTTVRSRVERDGEGVYRWTSNGGVVPLDAADEYGVTALAGYDRVVQAAAREREITAAVERYRAVRAARGYSAEERAEMRAAFGPGADVVDVLTGKRVRL